MPHFGDTYPFAPGRPEDPRMQSFLGMLKMYLCPSLKLHSFTCYMSISLILIFIMCCFTGINVNNGQLLEINKMILEKFGNIPIKVYKDNQIWRWLTAMFFHAEFLHIFFNAFSLCIVGSMVERAQGKFETCALFIISGICGNVFSSYIGDNSNNISVGASTGIYGLIGSLISYMILNWEAMEPYKEMRNINMCVLIFILFIFLFFGFGASMQMNSIEVDQNGHIGGLIGGFFFAMSFFTPFKKKGQYEFKVRLFGSIVGCFYLGIMVVLFYTYKF